jgi:hypothetical protein
MATEEFVPEWAFRVGYIQLYVESAGDALAALGLRNPDHYNHLMQHCRSQVIVNQKKQLAQYFAWVGLWAYIDIPINGIRHDVVSSAILPFQPDSALYHGVSIRDGLGSFLRSLQPSLRGSMALMAMNHKGMIEHYRFDDKGDLWIEK